MDRLTAIQVFLDIAQSGSFTATAEKLNLSRPMVTRYVALMEDWLNARLFHRTTRHVTLTDAGEQALILCEKLNQLSTQLQEETAQDEQLKGTLRLTSSIAFGSTCLMPMISVFQDLHPEVKIHLNLSEHQVNLAEQRIDLAIRFTNTPDPNLHARKLADSHSILVATPNYLARNGTPQQPEELPHHRCLAHAHVSRSQWTFQRDNQSKQIEFDSVFTTNDAQALLNACLAHNGIAMLPRYLLNGLIENGALIQVLPDWELAKYSIYALYSSKQRMPKSLRALVDFLVKEFEGKNW